MILPGGLPRLYPIVDAGLLARAGVSFPGFAEELRDAGIRFLQYRDKDGSDEEVLRRAALLRGIFPPADSCLILNDKVSLAIEANFDGAHVGQEDVPPARARVMLGPGALLGLSAHTETQLLAADTSAVDYIAIGPVFFTSSKQNPDPEVGLDGVRNARRLTAKPLVAIGGITRANCAAVLEAGADSVAVLSGLLARPGESTREIIRQFQSFLGTQGDIHPERRPPFNGGT